MIKILKYVTILNFPMNFILLKKLFPKCENEKENYVGS